VLLPGEHEFIGFDVPIAVEVEKEEKPLHFDESHLVVPRVVVGRVERQLARVLLQSMTNRQNGEHRQREQNR